MFCKQVFCFIAVLTTTTLFGCGGQDAVKNSLSDSSEIVATELNNRFKVGRPSTLNKKVLIHYLSWFGEGKTGRHWGDGVLNTPIIGYYDSQSWATHLYHILLSSALGIDGAVINVRTKYDQESFDKFISSIKRIDDIYPDFTYDISISYDDQHATINSSKSNFTHLKENTIPSTTHYLHKNEKPIVFIWDYDGYLTSQEYRDIADSVFTKNSIILLKNEIDSNLTPNEFVMNSFYPWVQGWSDDGSFWGKDYIEKFYSNLVDIKANNGVEFITGAVWPGFDDRNTIWGQSRWINRKNGATYDTMWGMINDKYIDKIDWVILETWNDFNEGTELEPTNTSESHHYVKLTAKNIHRYKGTVSLIDDDMSMFTSATGIYKAAKLIEDGERDYDTFYPKLRSSIEHYLKTNGEQSQKLSQEIIIGI